jgi:hypothetical protein
MNAVEMVQRCGKQQKRDPNPEILPTEMYARGDGIHRLGENLRESDHGRLDVIPIEAAP